MAASIYRCRESVKNASTPESARVRLISPLRVRHDGNKLQFNRTHIIFEENISDVGAGPGYDVGGGPGYDVRGAPGSVSYTHLTLPTILRV